MPKSTSLVIAAVTLAGAAGLVPAHAQKAAAPADGARKAAPAPAAAARKAAPVAAQPRRAVTVASAAPATAAASEAAPSLSEGQLDAAQRAFTDETAQYRAIAKAVNLQPQ